MTCRKSPVRKDRALHWWQDPGRRARAVNASVTIADWDRQEFERQDCPVLRRLRSTQRHQLKVRDEEPREQPEPLGAGCSSLAAGVPHEATQDLLSERFLHKWELAHNGR
jgi:hypothetical protein